MDSMVNTVRRHMRAPLLHTTCELGLSQSIEAVGARYGGGSSDFGLYKGMVKGPLLGCYSALALLRFMGAYELF